MPLPYSSLLSKLPHKPKLAILPCCASRSANFLAIFGIDFPCGQCYTAVV